LKVYSCGGNVQRSGKSYFLEKSSIAMGRYTARYALVRPRRWLG